MTGTRSIRNRRCAGFLEDALPRQFSLVRARRGDRRIGFHNIACGAPSAIRGTGGRAGRLNRPVLTATVAGPGHWDPPVSRRTMRCSAWTGTPAGPRMDEEIAVLHRLVAGATSNATGRSSTCRESRRYEAPIPSWSAVSSTRPCAGPRSWATAARRRNPAELPALLARLAEHRRTAGTDGRRFQGPRNLQRTPTTPPTACAD